MTARAYWSEYKITGDPAFTAEPTSFSIPDQYFAVTAVTINPR